jgi:hypothetical protein
MGLADCLDKQTTCGRVSLENLKKAMAYHAADGQEHGQGYDIYSRRTIHPFLYLDRLVTVSL